jgi:hypothetical protein
MFFALEFLAFRLHITVGFLLIYRQLEQAICISLICRSPGGCRTGYGYIHHPQ